MEAMSKLAPFHLRPVFVGRTWGRQDLSPWYLPAAPAERVAPEEPVGEAWLTGPDCKVADGIYARRALKDVAAVEPRALSTQENEFPLLIKLLFPDAKLSVQVHPNDEEAQALGISRGKTECWYVLDAQPGATVACGLREGVTIDALRAAIADGTAESLLEHLPVQAGDMVFVDAGTVHAIGPGVTILETQQTSDTTYRLYDYGRPRELHLEHGLAVSKTSTRAGKVAPQPVMAGATAGTRLIAEQYFTVDSFRLAIGDTVLMEPAAKAYCLTALRGDAEIAGEEGNVVMLPAGASAIVPAGTGTITVKAAAELELIRATP
jgi:mannose-6-phosphate isomerase